MNTFGTIKTKIENTAIKLSKKPEFKRFIFEFKHLVLENKDLSELYYIYDDLSSNRGIPNDIANDYINESIEYSQILLESQSRRLKDINVWINSWNKKNENNYLDIDNVIYKKGIKNLENILESKKNIRNIIIKDEVKKQVTESLNLPISSIVKIANENLKSEISSLDESEKNELNSIISMDFEKMKKEFNVLKEDVVKKLKTTLNESSEKDIDNTISKTIEKIIDAKCNYYDYYKLKKLSLGL